jgi:Leucine-rich repeat (LRR) protein
LQEEQLGSSSLCQIRSLDLSSLRIRDTGSVFTLGSPFQQLQELVLDDNQLLSLAPLAGLTSLMVLRANGNKLGTAEPVEQALNRMLVSQSPHRGGDAGGVSTGMNPGGGGGSGEGTPGTAWGGSGLKGSTGGLSNTSSTPPAVHGQEDEHEWVQGRELVMLPNLEVLQINGNGLSSLVPLQLQCLTGLRTLHAAGNELSRLEGLEGLGCLRELVLSKNKIRWVLEALPSRCWPGMGWWLCCM